MRKGLMIALMLLLIPMPVQCKTFAERVNIHGGITKTKRMSLWEIQRYRCVDLPRRYPFCYAPFKSYVAIWDNTEVTMIGNYNALRINKDLYSAVIDDARFNKKFAKRFKGRSIGSIFNYCARTRYVIHVKTARDVFSKRQGDCAGISAAFYVICKVNHIPVQYIIGWSGNYCHAWNRVKWKGKWYYVDCTMDRFLSRKLWKRYSIMEKW